jgi:SAM-dependent methyltransferase
MTVDGIDNSAEMLAQARRKAPSSSALVLQDIRRLDLPGSYDACVCLFDSLNYLDSADELHQVFRGVARVLRPGGCLIFDLNTIHALESGMFDQTGCGFDNRVTFEWRSAWEPEARRCTIRMEFRVREDGGLRVFHETHVQHAFTRREVESALVRAGFVGLECLEAYTIDPPTARTDRVYWIAQAPGAGGAAEAGAADGPRL